MISLTMMMLKIMIIGEYVTYMRYRLYTEYMEYRRYTEYTATNYRSFILSTIRENRYTHKQEYLNHWFFISDAHILVFLGYKVNKKYSVG